MEDVPSLKMQMEGPQFREKNSHHSSWFSRTKMTGGQEQWPLPAPLPSLEWQCGSDLVWGTESEETK